MNIVVLILYVTLQYVNYIVASMAIQSMWMVEGRYRCLISLRCQSASRLSYMSGITGSESISETAKRNKKLQDVFVNSQEFQE